MRYWKKELPETPIHLPVGRPIKFDHIDFDYGYLATEDGYINTELSKCASRRSGGVVEIQEQEYTEWLEKKAHGPSVLGLQRQRQSIGPQLLKRVGQPNAVEAVVVGDRPQVIGTNSQGQMVSDVAMPQKSAGLEVNRNFVKPRVGKISTLDD